MRLTCDKIVGLMENGCFAVREHHWRLFGSYAEPLEELSQVMPKAVRDVCVQARYATYLGLSEALVHQDIQLPVRFYNQDGQIVSVLVPEYDDWALRYQDDMTVAERVEGR